VFVSAGRVRHYTYATVLLLYTHYFTTHTTRAANLFVGAGRARHYTYAAVLQNLLSTHYFTTRITGPANMAVGAVIRVVK
jgi:hypothetical protein